jgi:hypothetical protein
VKAEMEKMMQMNMPGTEHAVLRPLEGNWAVTSRSWMKPGEKEETSSGTSVFKWVLNGRFLSQSFSGNWAGQPFEGQGYVGYDKIKKEYVSFWMDNMSTGVMQATSNFDPKTKTFAETGTYSDPMTGDPNRWFRSEWKIKSDNETTYTMYNKDEKGKEFKSMELTYKRAKA